MKRAFSVILMALLLCGVAVAADVYQQGKITRWENGTYPEKSKKMKNWIVYQLQTDTTTYSIARRKETKPRLQVGELVQYKLKDHQVTILDSDGKKENYQVVGQSAGPGQ